MRSRHRPDVEDLVHEHVGVAREPTDVRALTRVTREGNGAAGRVEAVAERREDRRVLHEDGAHSHAVLVLGVDDDRLHVGRRGLLARRVGADSEVDVGHEAVALARRSRARAPIA